MIDRLLHIANSRPPASKGKRDRFYAMKMRILRRFGTEDGHDLQYIPGKICFSCDGTGDMDDKHDCYKCGGDGWFKSPVWVLLKRWKLGGYSFHEPLQRLHRKPDTNSLPRPMIEGYIEHAPYAWHDVQRARFILSLLFDWKLLWSETDNWWLRRVIASRCCICSRRTWNTKQCYCSTCKVLLDAKSFLEQDNEVPF